MAEQDDGQQHHRAKCRALCDQERQAQEELKEVQVLKEAVELAQELPAVLVVMARLYEQRLQTIAKTDPFLQGLDQQAAAYSLKINLAAMASTKLRKQSFGIVLNSMTDETQVAREDTDLGNK